MPELTNGNEVQWRAEMGSLGRDVVMQKLFHSGASHGASVLGFRSAPHGVPRGIVEAWLAEEDLKLSEERSATLRWAQIAGWAGIVSAAIGAAALVASAPGGYFADGQNSPPQNALPRGSPR